MPRAVPEWIGKTDDTAVPQRVRLRVLARNDGRCQGPCGGHKITPADRWTTDHIVALINGGENRETNLQTLCPACTKIKDKIDVAAKSRTASTRGKHYGTKKPSSFPSRWLKGTWKFNWKTGRYEKIAP